MSDIWLFIIFVAGIAALVRTSGWLVSLLGWMAHYLKMGEYAVAFLLMAAATSIPELFVGINSAVSAIPHLALGNILGANLLNVTLVLGAAALLKTIPITDEKITHETSFIFTLTITPLILMLDGGLSRAEGAVLIFLFFAYVRYILVMSRIPNSVVNQVQPSPRTFKEFVQKLLLFIVGVGILVIASRVVVYAANIGAERLGIPSFMIGFLIVSLGTTLPELTFSISSVFNRHASMSIGNAIGSVVFNLTFILGVVALIQPFEITVDRPQIFINLVLVTAIAFFLNIVFRVTGKLGRVTALFLIVVYLLAVTLIFGLSFL